MIRHILLQNRLLSCTVLFLCLQLLLFGCVTQGERGVSTLETAPSPSQAPIQRRRAILKIAHKEPDTLDPHTSILGQTQAIVRFLYRGLTRFAIQDGRSPPRKLSPI